MFDIMYTPGLLGWVKVPDIKTIGYDLSDTQDGLKCWRMGFIFCGKHHLLLAKIQVSGLGPMGPLVTIVLNGKSRMSTRLLHLG